MSAAQGTARQAPTAARPPPTAFVMALLVPASMLGTLTRIGITQLLSYNGATLDPPIIWAQIVGCAVFGGALQNKALFEAVVLRRKKGTESDGDLQLGAALYTALTSGYCGSVTTFSTWILDIYLAWANYESIAPSRGKAFATGLSQSLVTLLLAFASFRLGMKCAEDGELFSLRWIIKLLPGHLKADPSRDEPEPLALQESALDRATPQGEADSASTANGVANRRPATAHASIIVANVLFAIGLFVMLSLLAALHLPSRSLALALVLSPPGAILRWYLSRFNGRPLSAASNRTLGSSGFPLGTFLANMIGVVVACGTWTALHTSSTSAASTLPYSPVTCAAIDSGLETGFSGALSTISTFIAELCSLGAGLQTRRAAVNYALLSWGWGLLLAVLLTAVPVASLNFVDRCTQ